MKFTKVINFYSVNEDNTVTFYFDDENGNRQFYRASARFKLLAFLDEFEKDTLINCEFGLAYVRGKGLVLQLIRVLDEK
ncbi:hypothetical protein J6Q66_02670 [bacterium]|nr:hypothetical protein [bacterium]